MVKKCWIIPSIVSCVLCSRCGWHQVGGGVSWPGVALITRVVDGVLGGVEDGPDQRAGNNLSWLSQRLGDLKTDNSSMNLIVILKLTTDPVKL